MKITLNSKDMKKYLDDKASPPALRRVLLREVINRAIKSPEIVTEGEIYFLGTMLERLVNNDYKDARKSMGLDSKHHENSGEKSAKAFQLIADVDYLVTNNHAKGAQGALKLLLERSPHYKNQDNLNSFQAAYREHVKKEADSWRATGSNAIEKGRNLLEITAKFDSAIKRDPLI